MATNNLLNQPAPGYRRFVDNQVLTDNQLNEVIDYLNHQDRLTRTLLHGVGIVCGLNLTYNNSDKKFHLSKGVAVTTAGDLLNPGGKTFTGFKKFDDANVKYRFFIKNEADTIALWALAQDTSPSDVHPLSQFKSKTDFQLNDAVALLYFEDYLDEEKDCSAVDCDTQGQQVVNRLRVLLVSPNDAKKIAEKDSIFSGFLQKNIDLSKQKLSHHFVPRVLLNPVNTKTITEFKDAYKLSFNSLAEKIDALGRISLFENTLDKSGINPVTAILALSPGTLNFQYLYDFYKDITTAYIELQQLLSENIGLCCPDPEAFPKHMLLGEVPGTEKVLRHRFYPSPTYGKSSVGQMLSLFERILFMIKDFSPDIKNEIKITPSRDESYPIGKRAVPFYFDLEKSENASGFIKKWKDIDTGLTPNYYGHLYPEPGFNPLDVTLDGHNFYRIEGHIGHHVMDAHENLQKQRNSKSLPFDIKPVAIGQYPEEGVIDFDKYRVYFEDLQVVLEAWNEEQQCLIRSANKFLSGFSIKEPGKHTAYPEKTVNEGNIIGNIDFTRVVDQPAFTPVFFAETRTHSKTTQRVISKKTTENQVLMSYAAAEESFGQILKENVKITDTKNDILVNIVKWIPDMVLNWNSDIREAAITIPGQMIGHLKEVEDFRLTGIEDFSDEKLNAFLQSLHNLCQHAKAAGNRIQQLAARENSELKSKIWLNDYLNLLNRIAASCCLIEKFKVLYQTILERKRELLGRLILQKFISDHPGAEHKAGVERGGTFILLYYSRNTAPASQQRLTSAGIQNVALLRNVPQGEAIRNLPDNMRIEMETLMRSPGSLFTGTGGSTVRISERLRPSQIENIPHGTVIGDLCLPYICCSDSPSTTFVFPEQLASLRLPVDHVCVDEDENTNSIPMTVLPAGGTVKAFIQNREIENVISKKDNGMFFDPNKVSREDYGQTIRFEVNGQSVDPFLHVLQKPKAKFSVLDNTRFEKRNTIAILTIKNSSEPFDELQFEWNISGQTIGNENATEFTHLVPVQPGQSMPLSIKLTAFNDYCEDSQTENITIDVPTNEEPVEPEPDEPVRNCKDRTVRAIETSLNLIQREVSGNQNLLRDELIQLASRVHEMYTAVLQSADEALAGRFDDNMFGMIQDIQLRLQNHVAVSNRNVQVTDAVEKQREIIIILYYQLIYLYFYLQACREDRITVHRSITEVSRSWPLFTKQATGDLQKQLQTVLSKDPVHEKLSEIQKQMKNRFDTNIKKMVSDMIKLLKTFIDRR